MRGWFIFAFRGGLRGKKGDGLGEIEMLGNYGANSRFSFEKQK